LVLSRILVSGHGKRKVRCLDGKNSSTLGLKHLTLFGKGQSLSFVEQGWKSD